jgi:hypothetical protein
MLDPIRLFDFVALLPAASVVLLSFGNFRWHLVGTGFLQFAEIGGTLNH